jgi:hypothetical protein
VFDLSDEITRPGFMLYLEDYEVTKELPKEMKGMLWEASFEYVKFGVMPEFTGIELLPVRIAWSSIRSKLDHDQDRYVKKVLQSKHAVYCREFRKNNPGKEPMEYEEWETCYRPVSPDNERYPTTTATATSTTTSTTTTTTAGKATATRGAGGEGEGKPKPVQSSPSVYGFYDTATPVTTEEQKRSRMDDFWKRSDPSYQGQ